MTLPAPISDKLSKLIPRLASDHDGEVLNTVHAIRRTLESAGKDLHDLARRLSFDPPRPETRRRAYEPPRPQSRWPRWERLSSGERVMALDLIGEMRLSPWETEFVRSIDGMLRRNPYVTLSQRQTARLNDLLVRAQEEVQ